MRHSQLTIWFDNQSLRSFVGTISRESHSCADTFKIENIIRKRMNLGQLKYIKSISHPDGIWSYSDYSKGTYFPLNFHRSVGVEAHASNLPKGALVILSQNYRGTRYLSHVVEIVNEASEDRPQWESSDLGIVRWVKVIWAAEQGKAPEDRKTLKVNWGWENTRAKALDGDNLMKEWKTIDALRLQVSKALEEADRVGE